MVNTAFELFTAGNHTGATLGAIQRLAGGSAYAYRRRGGADTVSVLVAALADQAGHCAQSALDETEEGIVFLRLGLVELIGFDFHLRIGTHRHRAAVSK